MAFEEEDRGMGAAVSEAARSLVYPVAESTRRLEALLMRRVFGRPSPDNHAGRLAVEAIHALERTERTLRTMYVSDYAGL